MEGSCMEEWLRILGLYGWRRLRRDFAAVYNFLS